MLLLDVPNVVFFSLLPLVSVDGDLKKNRVLWVTSLNYTDLVQFTRAQQISLTDVESKWVPDIQQYFTFINVNLAAGTCSPEIFNQFLLISAGAPQLLQLGLTSFINASFVVVNTI